MQTSIEGKLTALLADPIDTEAKAVYLLCQARKLQDYDNAGPNRLRMFCNWAVHVELEARSTVEPFLQHIDDVLGHKLAGVLTPQSFATEPLSPFFSVLLKIPPPLINPASSARSRATEKFTFCMCFSC